MGDLKIFNIDEIKREFNLDVFIETGTLHGDTVDWLCNTFDELHSIEIDEDLYQKANNRFAGISKVKIHHGHSTDILVRILPSITKSALFWLDAHFPGADIHRVSYDNEKNEDIRVPLYHEIQEIAKRKHTHKDVIIVDDLWLYEDGKYEWGTFDKHAERCNFNVTRSQLVSKNSSFLYEAFEDTHDVTKIDNHQGYLVFMPKTSE